MTTLREVERPDVGELRAAIDTLDADIRSLVERRHALSQAVQHARITAGGPRVETAREMDVIKGYADRFGRQGGTIALALLEICRGASKTTG